MASTLLCVTSAAAQGVDPPLVEEGPIAVLERPRPEYEPIGAQVGPFTFFPSVELKLEANDNVLASVDERRADLALLAAPTVRLRSDWSRHRLEAVAGVAQRKQFTLRSESSTDVLLQTDALVEVNRSELIAHARYETTREPRTTFGTPVAAASPLRYRVAEVGSGGTLRFARLSVFARGDWRSFEFKDNRNREGTVLPQGFRSFEETSVTTRIGYEWTDRTSIFVSLFRNARDYRTARPGESFSDSRTVSLTAGGRTWITSLLHVEAELGTSGQSFDSNSGTSISGLSARGRATWYPTTLLTINAEAGRAIRDVPTPTADGVLSQSLSVQADWEILRNVIFSARISRSADDYPEGLTLRRTNAELRASWLLSNRLEIGGRLAHMAEGTNLPPRRDLAVTTLVVGTKLKW